jgi:hypothetical protein
MLLPLNLAVRDCGSLKAGSMPRNRTSYLSDPSKSRGPVQILGDGKVVGACHNVHGSRHYLTEDAKPQPLDFFGVFVVPRAQICHPSWHTGKTRSDADTGYF